MITAVKMAADRFPLLNMEVTIVTVVTAVTVRLGCPQRCHPSGEHPENAPHRRGIYSPFFRLVNPSCVRKIPGFFRQRLQGVTHYTLPARWCARRSLWTPFMQGLRPAPRRLRLREKAVPVTVLCHLGGYPITTVITVTRLLCERNQPALFLPAVRIPDMVVR